MSFLSRLQGIKANNHGATQSALETEGNNTAEIEQSSAGQTGNTSSLKMSTFRLPQFVFSRTKTEEQAEDNGILAIWKKALKNPAFNYQFLWLLIICLSLVGLFMQFSSVTIKELHRGISPYWGISRPLLYFLAGYFCLFAARVFSSRFYMKYKWVFFIIALILQSLVLTGIGKAQNGNRNWILIPGTGTAVQPSEFLKVAFIVLLAALISKGYCNFKSPKSVTIWMGIPYIICVCFVYFGKDLGTVLTFTSISLVVCYACGIKKRFLAYAFCFLSFAAIALVMASSSRIKRVKSFIFGGEGDPLGADYQTIHAKYGLGTGGLTGIGPGASREKWLYLPEAQTDYIYAILGEEFGFLGTLTVIFMFIALAWVLLRIVLQSKQLCLKVCAAGTVGWVVVQAAINIGVVVGLLPVIGLPLPLISSGGSSQVASMLMFGIIFALMKSEPELEKYLKRRSKAQIKTSVIQTRAK